MVNFKDLMQEIEERRAQGLPDFPEHEPIPVPPITWHWAKHPDLGWVASADIPHWDTENRPQVGDVITVVRRNGQASQQRVVEYIRYGNYPQVVVEPVNEDAP